MARQKSKYVIGVDLGGTNVRAGLVKDGKILKFEARRIRSHGTKEQVLEDLCAVIDAVKTEKISGIGLGVPSLVNQETGVIQNTTNIPSWTKVPLRRLLEKKYRTEVVLNNDAKCFALGEQLIGYGKNCENFVGLIIGTGLGCGIISKGHLVSGSFCGAGEFGLIPYKDSIVEHYASGQFFRRHGSNGAQVHLEAAGGDERAKEIFHEYGQHLGHAIKNILYAFAPEMIVMGGAVSQSYSMFKKSLEESLKDFAYPCVRDGLKIKVSKVKNVSILGAAHLLTEIP